MRKEHFTSWISIFGITAFIVFTLTVHLINPDVDAVKLPVSFYALVKLGELQNIGFFMIGLSEIFLAFNIGKMDKLNNSFIPKILFTAGIAVFVIGIFPMDINKIRTWHGLIHIYSAAIHFILFSVVSVLTGYKLPTGKMRSFSLFTGYSTFVILVFISIILRYEESTIFKFYGLIQRFDILIIITWLIVINIYFLSRN